MKKIIVILFSLVLILGYANIALAVTDEEPVKVESEVEDVQEEIVVEEEPEAVVDETSCPHTWGEWYYDVDVTYFRSCECGAYEELSEQEFYDAGGQYENCDKGRHYWCEKAGIRYCEECGYSEKWTNTESEEDIDKDIEEEGIE